MIKFEEILQETKKSNNIKNKLSMINEHEWYHGTSLKNWNKIQKSGFMFPNLSDDEEYGKAIWFTSDIKKAKTFGKVILAISNENSLKFKRKFSLAMDAKFGKNIGMTKSEIKDYNDKIGYTLLIFQKIPINYIKNYKSKI